MTCAVPGICSVKVEDPCICSGKLLTQDFCDLCFADAGTHWYKRHQCRTGCLVLFFHLNILNLKITCKGRNNDMQWTSMCLFWLLGIVTLYDFLIHTCEEKAWCYVADRTYFLRIKPFLCFFFFFFVRRAKMHEHFCVLGVAELNPIESFEL